MPAAPATPPATPEPSGRGPGARLGRALGLALLLAAVAVAAGLLLGPPGAGALPGPEDLGRPAPATVRADRDYELEDAEATARRRGAAAAAERPVYDHDDRAVEEAAARIHAAFALMRQEEAALRGQRPSPEPAELARRYATQRDAFVARLQVLVREEDLAALSAARFSEEVERDLTALAAKGLTGLVVGDRALLPSAAEAGLTVRSSHDGEVTSERVLTDQALIRDLATARDEVARAAAARLASLPPALRGAVLHLSLGAIRPTLVHNQGETERRRAEAAARVRPVSLVVRRGERIVAAGERIEPRHLALLDALRARHQGESRGQVRLGAAALVALLALVLWRFASGGLGRSRPPLKDAALLSVLLVGGLALVVGGLRVADLLGDHLPGLPREVVLALLPLGAGAVVAGQALGGEAALLLAVATGLGVGQAAGGSLALAASAVITSLAAAAAGGRNRTRGGLLLAGAAAGAAGAALAVALGLQGGRGLTEVATLAGASLAGGLLLLPPVAWLALRLAAGPFGYVTRGRLLALANLNHPALKELIVQAPGTYHHSILVGSLAESAARAIGADPLLAKVGAYFHDLGKIRNPLFFAENQRGRNEHDALAPSMSALVVKRHVTDGLELARRWRLPRAVAEVIPQHHGTRVIGYFWAKQQKLSEAGEAAGPADEALFRYAGPKPRSREAALVMLADVCEASARALEKPTTAALEAMVALRVREVVAEGQLDECELTLGELTAVERVLVQGLAGFHLGAQAVAQLEPAAPRPPVHLVGRP